MPTPRFFNYFRDFGDSKMIYGYFYRIAMFRWLGKVCVTAYVPTAYTNEAYCFASITQKVAIPHII